MIVHGRIQRGGRGPDPPWNCQIINFCHVEIFHQTPSGTLDPPPPPPPEKIFWICACSYCFARNKKYSRCEIILYACTHLLYHIQILIRQDGMANESTLDAPLPLPWYLDLYKLRRCFADECRVLKKNNNKKKNKNKCMSYY